MKNFVSYLAIKKWTAKLAAIYTHKIAQTLLASWLIILGAHISVPFYPVKMTLQTLAIAFISLSLPYQSAISSVLLYLGYAAVGLPVLAGGNAGMAALMGPTMGYLIGFIGMSATTSLLMHHYPTTSFIKRFAFALLGDSIVFLLGIMHLTHLFGIDIAIKTGLLPFILGDLVKLATAAMVSLPTKDKRAN
jgi:biotin transport system substrate-specific component